MTKIIVSLSSGLLVFFAGCLTAEDPAADFSQAVNLTEKGMYEDAIEIADKILESDPTHGNTYHIRGRAHFKLGKFERALEDYNKAIDIWDDRSIYYMSRFLLYRDLGKFDLGDSDLHRACELEKRDRFNDGDPDFEKWCSGDFSIDLGGSTKTPVPTATAKVPAATATATAVPTVIPTISVSVEYYRQAEDLQQDEKFREAIEFYAKAIDADPMFVNAYYKRGSSLLELNQYEEAIADFDVALDLSDYHDPSIYGKRGHAFRLLGRYEESISEYETQKQKDPTNAWPYHYIGMSFFEMGRYYQAIASWETYAERRVAEGDPRPDSYGRIGDAFMKLGIYDEAIRRFEMALEISPNNGNMIAKRDEARGLSGRSTPASRAENSADQRVDYFDLAMSNFESQDYEGAIDNLTKALDDHPDPHQVYIMRSIVYLAKESFGDALRDIDVAINIDPNYTQQYALRAEANYGLGNMEAFEADFAAARESDPYGAGFFIQREDELRIDGQHDIADIYRQQACILEASYCK